LSSSGPRAAIKALGESFLLDAKQRLSEAWGDSTQARPVVMPLGIRLGRNR
jgi:hypothetical protein